MKSQATKHKTSLSDQADKQVVMDTNEVEGGSFDFMKYIQAIHKSLVLQESLLNA